VTQAGEREPLRALVTGAAGFVGGHLWRQLLAAGVDATGLDMAPSRRGVPDGARLLQVDIRDEAAVRRTVLETRPQVLYHLAAQASVVVSMREPVLDIETNVLGSIHLAQAAIEAGVRRFVFFSTGGALFGAPETIPVREDTPAHPLSVYGASKLAAERYLELLCAPTEITLSVVRPGNIYGPWQDPHGEAGVVAIFAQRMLANEPVTIFGDGSQRRDYVYVDDVVDAAMRAGTQEAATCLIGTGLATSTREVFDAVASSANYERPPVFGPERAGDIPQIAQDASRARTLWGWTPHVEFSQGIARTVEFFRQQRDGPRR
jgi:UDP-glucose 4-epimerase